MTTSDDLAHDLDVEEVVLGLLGRIRDELRVDTVTVLLLDPYGLELVATASIGLEEEVAQGFGCPSARASPAGSRAPARPCSSPRSTGRACSTRCSSSGACGPSSGCP
ncbi:hypothetical protein ACFQX7_38685 [Luedemannella flava]